MDSCIHRPPSPTTNSRSGSGKPFSVASPWSSNWNPLPAHKHAHSTQVRTGSVASCSAALTRRARDQTSARRVRRLPDNVRPERRAKRTDNGLRPRSPSPPRPESCDGHAGNPRLAALVGGVDFGTARHGRSRPGRRRRRARSSSGRRSPGGVPAFRGRSSRLPWSTIFLKKRRRRWDMNSEAGQEISSDTKNLRLS